MSFKVRNLGNKPVPFPKIFYHLNFSLKNPNLAWITYLWKSQLLCTVKRINKLVPTYQMISSELNFSK